MKLDWNSNLYLGSEPFLYGRRLFLYSRKLFLYGRKLLKDMGITGKKLNLMKKYRLLKEDYIKFNGKILYRIQALKNFSNVNKGDLGGYIESEDNLSHFGTSWIYHKEAMVFENAAIYEDAKIIEEAIISGNAWIFGNAQVAGRSLIFENAKIYGDTKVLVGITLSGNVRICGTTVLVDKLPHLAGDTFISNYCTRASMP